MYRTYADESNFDPTPALLSKVELVHDKADEHKWARWQVIFNTGNVLWLGYCGFDDAADEARQIAAHRGYDSVMLVA